MSDKKSFADRTRTLAKKAGELAVKAAKSWRLLVLDPRSPDGLYHPVVGQELEYNPEGVRRRLEQGKPWP
ncbi:MAG: hypothetical protein IT307_12535 [Chloroflexi bacterium]|nr:hypothetical protein [Chloroflexota bacterium]